VILTEKVPSLSYFACNNVLLRIYAKKGSDQSLAILTKQDGLKSPHGPDEDEWESVGETSLAIKDLEHGISVRGVSHI